MRGPDVDRLAHGSERGPLEVAQERWGVDLNDDRATLRKLVDLRGKMPDVADLGNIWQEYQQQKGRGEIEEAA